VLAARVPGEDESAGKATPWLRRRESSLVDTCCTRSGMAGRGEAGNLREEAERPQHVCLRGARPVNHGQRATREIKNLRKGEVLRRFSRGPATKLSVSGNR